MTTTTERRLMATCKVICDHWPRPPEWCSMLCQGEQYSKEEGCPHRAEVHGKMAVAMIRVAGGVTT